MIAGNHDITLDSDFYEQHSQHFHNQNPQDLKECLNLAQKYKSITFLNHESAHIQLKRDDGPHTSFKVFGSPYSPANGLWAFGYPPEDAVKTWDKIPPDIDIVVTHTPPKYHCDGSRDRGAAGCEALRQNLWRIRPCLAVCGHVHEGRGVERIRWDLEAPSIQYKESSTAHWEDSGLGNKKQSLVDLSSKSSTPLDNSGHDAARRKETCIINSSIMATSWPYKSKNDRKYNKPIVVDLDLSVWQEKDDGALSDQNILTGVKSMSSLSA